jgi:hypothetical protein
MPETEETTSKTVVANKNKVTIALDEYDDLKARAIRPTVTNMTVLRKTDEQNAADNKAWGIVLGVLGSACAAAGAFMFKHGKKGLK